MRAGAYADAAEVGSAKGNVAALLDRLTGAAEGRAAWAGPLAMAVGVAAVGLVVIVILGGDFYDSEFVLAVCSAIVVVGMVVQVGYGHQLAFSQSVFMAFGAYGAAVLNTKYGVSIQLATVVVTVAAAAIGFLLGAVATRAPGFALAFATLFFPLIGTGIVIYSNYLGGTTGLLGIAPLWSGSSFGSTLERSGAVAVVVLAACVFVCSRILRSGIGLELAVLARSERAAAALGVPTRRRKLELLVLGSTLAALAGAMFAGTQLIVSYTSFNLVAEIVFLVMLYIGGRNRILGGLIGAVGIQYLSGTSNFVDINLPIFEGVLLTAVLLFAPGGFIELLDRLARRLLKLDRAHESPKPGTPAAGTSGNATSARGTMAEASSNTPRGGAGAAGDAPGVGEVFGVAPGVDSRPGAGASAHQSPAHRTAARTPRAPISSPSPAARPGERPADLRCEILTKRFGGVLAVDAVTLEIRGNGVHSICGPNGAGKSTLFELVAGGMPADSGSVFLNGRDVTRKPAYRRAELGIARTLQTVRLMNDRSVLDNVAVATLQSHRTFMTRALIASKLREATARARDALARLGIEALANRHPAELTLESQRMVGLATAIAARPTLLLLDEPASGLSVEQHGRLAETLLKKSRRQTTVLLVEHDLQMVADISCEVFVLVEGRLTFSGPADTFLDDAIVRRELMGLAETPVS